MTNEPGRVMVADDEHHVRQFLRELLSSEGYEVVVLQRVPNCSKPCRPSIRTSSWSI